MGAHQQQVTPGPPRSEQPEHEHEQEQPAGPEQRAEQELGPDAGQQGLGRQQAGQEDVDARAGSGPAGSRVSTTIRATSSEPWAISLPDGARDRDDVRRARGRTSSRSAPAGPRPAAPGGAGGVSRRRRPGPGRSDRGTELRAGDLGAHRRTSRHQRSWSRTRPPRSRRPRRCGPLAVRRRCRSRGPASRSISPVAWILAVVDRPAVTTTAAREAQLPRWSAPSAGVRVARVRTTSATSQAASRATSFEPPERLLSPSRR